MTDIKGLTPEQQKNFDALHDSDSHKKFMENKRPIARVDETGIRDAKQHMRRDTLIQGQMEATRLVRVLPGTGANIEYVSFDKWCQIKREFELAVKDHGMGIYDAAEAAGFQPLPTYINKILPANGKKIRDVLVNEVGVRPTGTIVCLEDRMPGDVGTVVIGPHTFKEGQ